MTRNILTFIRSLYSDEALQKLYEQRKSNRPDDGARTKTTILVTLALLFVVMIILVVAAWVPTDMQDYLNSRDQIVQLNAAQAELLVSDASISDCAGPETCYATMLKMPLHQQNAAQIDAIANPTNALARRLIRVDIHADAWVSLKNLRAIVVGLPRYRFKQADLFVNGNYEKTFRIDEAIDATIEQNILSSNGLKIEIVFTLDAQQRALSGGRQGNEGIIVASSKEFDSYSAELARKRRSSSGTVGMVAKIAVAFFCLLLFLIVDGSPDSLGLALFMGFEAAAMALGENWLPLGDWLSQHRVALINYCYQMGDILKLYFVLQLTRMSDKNAKTWLLWGTVASIPYGFFIEYAQYTGITWTYIIPRSRDTFVGGLGFLICVRCAWYLRHQRLPWRQIALGIAAVASLFEAINSWVAHWAFFNSTHLAQSLYTISQANVGYLFALSTFINISTLENRVRSLTLSQVKSRELERELEISRNVQRSLLMPPKLPAGIGLACYQEAAQYVSGDTYFVDWNEPRQTFAFLINDVTGHGMPAALKASACNILAKAIWSGDEGLVASSSGTGTKLQKFDELTQRLLLNQNDGERDFNSLIAAEFSVATGMLALYRSNFTFPILIIPHNHQFPHVPPDRMTVENWIVEVVVAPNQQIYERKLPRGSFLVFLSDGFIDASRDLKKFIGFLRQQLTSQSMHISVQHIHNIILSYEGFLTRRAIDDRTLLVFQWTLSEAEQKAS